MIHHHRRALIISGTYFLVSFVYILVSGRLAAMVAPSIMELAEIEKIKGILFVIFSAGFVYWFSSWQLKSVAREATDLLDHRDALLVSERRVIVATTVAAGTYVIKAALNVAFQAIDKLKVVRAESKAVAAIQEAKTSLESLFSQSQLICDAGLKEIAGQARRIDLCTLLESSIEIAQLHAAVRKCIVKFSGCKALEVFLFPAMIHSMILALLLNAAEAAGEEGKIEVHVRDDVDGVTIEVHDSGPGIPAELRGTVFAPFFTTRERSAGLGLLAVHACVEAHNGRVEIFTSHLGGARFDIAFPGSIRT